MSTPKNNGGPAFPHMADLNGWDPLSLTATTTQITSGGMTLRDWFAGQALAGFVARVPYGAFPADFIVASQAYQIADAMLAERAKPEGQP